MCKGVRTAAVVAVCIPVVMNVVDFAFAQDARKSSGIVSGDCRTTAQKFLIATKPVSINGSANFTALPERLTFVQGGRMPACVIVSFAAEAKGNSSSVLQVRPTLDGNANSLPPVVILVAGNSFGYASYAMNYVFTAVTPGAHVLKIEFASSSVSFLQTRSIVLSYVK